MYLLRVPTFAAVCLLLSQSLANSADGSPVGKTVDARPQIVMHPGLPREGIQCDSSWAVLGDLLPSARHSESASDVTEIDTVYSGSPHLGWIYREHDGSRFWQSDFAKHRPVGKTDEFLSEPSATSMRRLANKWSVQRAMDYICTVPKARIFAHSAALREARIFHSCRTQRAIPPP